MPVESSLFGEGAVIIVNPIYEVDPCITDDTKELPMEGISPEFRGSLSHLMMHAVNNRVDAYMELFLRHPLSIRRYYRQFDY